MRINLAIVSLVALSLTGEAAAQQVHIAGVGMGSCGVWAEARRLNKAEMLEQWVVGFLSGVAVGAAGKLDPLHGTDFQGVISWIDNYCSVHPLKQVSDAAQGLMVAHPR